MKTHPIALDKKFRGIVVVTGCDSGVGKSLVSVLLQMGYTVVQSYLNNNAFLSVPDVYSEQLDLRKPEEVKQFCVFVNELCNQGKKLEGIILNAGVALGGPIENLPIGIFRESFEINFFGAVEIIQALIPQLIKNQGKIIIHGSMAGRVALPYLSPYVATKFALEGFSDSLRREMKPLGVKTVLLESAAIATPIWNKAKKQDISFVDKKYLHSLYQFRDTFIEGGNSGMEAEQAALKIAGILDQKKPKSRYIIAKNPLGSQLLKHIPNAVLDPVMMRMFRMKVHNK